MKRSRPLSLFLSVLILISCFTISVSADNSENLINPKLYQWDKIYPDCTVINKYTDDKYLGGQWYEMLIKPQTMDTPEGKLYIRVGGVFELTNLEDGVDYKFSCHILSPSEMGRDSEFIKSVFGAGSLYVGLCQYSGSADYVVTDLSFVEGQFFEIDSTNFDDYLGNDLNINITSPQSYTGKLGIAIVYLGANSDDPRNGVLGFANIQLINKTQEKEDGIFDRIFQFFHDLKWELIGGSCGDSDCSKTPHTSLADKISVMFNEALDGLKWFFHDLKWEIIGGSCGDSDCSKSPHRSLAEKVVTGISDFFRGFGNLILYFNWEGEYSNPFEREDSPIDKVSAFFADLIEYVDSIGTSIENVLDSITGGLHIFDEFTSRFPWLKGIAVFCLALIVITRFIGL